MSAWPPWPIDTITVTAAIPITTPRTVSPERSLFLASWRRDRTTRSTTFTAHYPFDSGDERLVRLDVAGNEFGKLRVHQPDGDGNGNYLVPLLRPHHPLVLGLRLF